MPAAPAPSSAQRYGYQRSATHAHQGIDLAAPEGSSVITPWGGEVVHVNTRWRQGFGGYGKAVVVRVDGAVIPTWVLFAHLSRVEVKPGDHLEPGARVGFVGRTKYSAQKKTDLFAESAPHLHFEVSLGPYPQRSEAKTRLDPLTLLEGPS